DNKNAREGAANEEDALVWHGLLSICPLEQASRAGRGPSPGVTRKPSPRATALMATLRRAAHRRTAGSRLGRDELLCECAHPGIGAKARERRLSEPGQMVPVGN